MFRLFIQRPSRPRVESFFQLVFKPEHNQIRTHPQPPHLPLLADKKGLMTQDNEPNVELAAGSCTLMDCVETKANNGSETWQASHNPIPPDKVTTSRLMTGLGVPFLVVCSAGLCGRSQWP